MSNLRSDEMIRMSKLIKLIAKLNRINKELEIERKRGDDLTYLCKMIEDPNWWNNPIDGLNKDQLLLLKKALEEMKKRVDEPADRLLIQSAPTETKPRI
ncbi:unnamed protein product [Trifolium pratense]|uniref:Uncharacterized protein n=1 Tax=Trifolium pratense TaxID=57577 RepID=A0ACB0LD60_TRIPR|nr:unnamed protein product [Trifolium pratense]